MEVDPSKTEGEAKEEREAGDNNSNAAKGEGKDQSGETNAQPTAQGDQK